MGLGIYVKDPEIYQEIGQQVKFTLDDKVWSEVFFVILVGVGLFFVTLKGPFIWIFRYLSKVSVWGD